MTIRVFKQGTSWFVEYPLNLFTDELFFTTWDTWQEAINFASVKYLAFRRSLLVN